MSYYRPDSASLLTINTARIVGIGGAVMALTMLPVALPSALLLGATSLATWRSAEVGSKARSYNIKRQEAFEKADKAGATPKLPPNPFLNPNKQPSTFTTGFARLGAATSLIAGTLFLFSPAAPIATSLLLLTVGGTSLRMTNIAEKARHYAEQEQAVHQKRSIDEAQSPITPSPSIDSPAKSHSQGRGVYGKHTAALMAERNAIRSQQKEM